MYDDDLSLLELEEELADPLDTLVALQEGEAKPDPELMLSWLQSRDGQQRLEAARAFCDLQDNRAVKYLIPLLREACPLTRVSAAYALGRNPSPEAMDPLIERLGGDWNGFVRKAAAWALGNYPDRKVLQPLLEALKTDIAAVRLWAASSLGNTAVVDYEAIIDAIPRLIEALRRDPVAVVRSNCAWSLGRLIRELPSNVVYATVIDGLVEAMVEDDDMGVREDAKEALLKVGDPRALQMIEELRQEGLVW